MTMLLPKIIVLSPLRLERWKERLRVLHFHLSAQFYLKRSCTNIFYRKKEKPLDNQKINNLPKSQLRSRETLNRCNFGKQPP